MAALLLSRGATCAIAHTVSSHQDRPACRDHVSSSARRYGKSKNPGWYHTSRKQLYQHRSKLKTAAPQGIYTSHTKYADEAVRIKNTGRLAF